MRRFLWRYVLPFLVSLGVGNLLWWLTTPQPRVAIERDQPFMLTKLSPDGSLLLGCEAKPIDGVNQVAPPQMQLILRFFATDSGREVTSWDAPPSTFPREFGEQGVLVHSFYVTAGQRFVVARFDPVTQTESILFDRDLGPVKMANISSDGRLLALLRPKPSNNVEVWDLAKQERIQSLEVASPHEMELSLSSDGRYLVVTDFDLLSKATAPAYFVGRLYETESGVLRDTLAFPVNEMAQLYFRPGTHVLHQLQRMQMPTFGNAITSLGEFYDADVAAPFATKKSAENATPDGDTWVVERLGGDVEVHNGTGERFTVPRSVTGRISTSQSYFVPNSSLLAFKSGSGQFPPSQAELWAAQMLGRVGYGNGFPTWWEGVVLFNYRTGQTEWVWKSTSFPKDRPPNMPLKIDVLPAPDGRFIAIGLPTATNWRTEIWDLPVAKRPTAWIILCSVVCFALLAWFARRVPTTSLARSSPRL